MKEIKVIYPEIPNMGDLLNPLIIENLFGVKVIRSNRFNTQMVAIGSGLGAFQWEYKLTKMIPQLLSHIFMGNLHVWGTGFIHSNEAMTQNFFRKNVTFHALRGEKTKKRVEKILRKEIDVPLGDGGLLASKLIEVGSKKHRIGIVPHFKEQDCEIFKKLAKKHDDSIIIDLKDDPVKVLKDISECEVIISSSLHGLIVADSFGIPNVYMKVTDNLMGDGFKFEDYYSSYGLMCKPIHHSNALHITYKDICDNYEISKTQVENKKIDLINSFPKNL